MDEYGKSDRSVVPVKPPNKTAVAEVVEERDLVKGNAASATRPGLRAGHDATSALDRVRRRAATDKEARFTALLHHVTVDRLRTAYRGLDPERPAGAIDAAAYEASYTGLREPLLTLLHNAGFVEISHAEIARAHDGHLSLSSDAAETRFTLRMPVAPG